MVGIDVLFLVRSGLYLKPAAVALVAAAGDRAVLVVTADRELRRFAVGLTERMIEAALRARDGSGK